MAHMVISIAFDPSHVGQGSDVAVLGLVAGSDHFLDADLRRDALWSEGSAGMRIKNGDSLGYSCIIYI